jgi:hypothetical protein
MWIEIDNIAPLSLKANYGMQYMQYKYKYRQAGDARYQQLAG